MIAETIYNGKILYTDCYMTERQWMDHVERHAIRILKRYIRRKIIILYNRIIDLIPFICGTALFYIVYCIVCMIAGNLP